MKVLRTALAVLTAATMLSLAPASPSEAASVTVTKSISGSGGKTTASIVRTAWTVKVSGTLTKTGKHCVYVETKVIVDNGFDSKKRGSNVCGSKASYSLSTTPGKGSKLSKVEIKVCSDRTMRTDPCTKVTVTVPAERAAKPGTKGTVDKHFKKSMANFQKAKKAQSDKSAGLNWVDNGCSSPTGNKPGGFNFLPACQRHDFGYANYGKGAIRTAPTDAQRLTVDKKFLSDMTAECNKYSGKAQVNCLGWAGTYYSAVRLQGGRAFYRN